MRDERKKDIGKLLNDKMYLEFLVQQAKWRKAEKIARDKAALGKR